MAKGQLIPAGQGPGPNKGSALLEALTQAMQELSASIMKLVGVNENLIQATLAQGRPAPQALPTSKSIEPRGAASAGNPFTEFLTGSSGLGGIVSKASASILAALAPVALFASALNSQISGMGAFLKTVQLVTTIMAGVFLPAFLAAGAVMLSIADYLGQFIGGKGQLTIFKLALDEVNRSLTVTSFLFNLMNKGMAFFIDSLARVMSLMARMIQGVFDSLPLPAKMAIGPQVGDFVDAIKKGAQNLQDEANKYRGVDKGERRADGVAVPANPNGVDEKGPFGFINNLRIMMNELRQSIGGQAQITGLAQARDNAQMAAFNRSEIERKMLEIMLKQLDAMEQVVKNIRPIGA